MYCFVIDLRNKEGKLDQLVGQARQHGDGPHIPGVGGVLSRVQVRGGELLGRREEGLILEVPGIYVYVVSAKITRLPSNLSASHSYYQHGHDDTSETRGVFDEERSSYFPHAPRAPRAPFQHVQAPHLYVRCEC